MKIKLALILVLLSGFCTFAQDKWKKIFTSIDLVYSQKLYQNAFYGQLNTFQEYSAAQISQCIGVAMTGTIHVSDSYSEKKSGYKIPGSLLFSIMLPRNITIADTLSGKISGFNFSIPVFGIDLLPKFKNADLLFTAGFNTGRLRMYKNEQMRQKNPYFSPQVSLTPRFKLGKVALSLNLGYEYDISKTGWRRTQFSKRETKINVDNFRQSGIMASFSIGYVLK